MGDLARLDAGQGKLAQAEPLYGRVLAIREKALGPAHPALVVTLDAYAGVLRGLGRETEAAGLEARAGQIRAVR